MKRQKILILGHDGFLGFPLTLRCLTNGHVVHGIDNLSRRKCVEEMGSVSATNITRPRERDSDLGMIGSFTSYYFNITKEPERLGKLIQKNQFHTIVNLAHNPSAPFSQIDLEHSNDVLTNNIIGTNNLLWFVKLYSPDTHIITIGTTGEYNHTINVDIEEGRFKFIHNGRESKECLFPREANSIYHASKISSTYIIDYLTRLWNLKTTDVMQGIVYGNYTPELEQYKQVNRLDSDECFGTLVHRFVVQGILGVPLTIYGHGKHQRPMLALNDSIQALEIAINNPATPGSVQTWNQLSEWHSICDVADIVKSVIPNTKSINIDSPRKEFTGGHYYNFITDKLKNLGYTPTRTLRQEIEYMVSKIKIDDRKSEILKSVVQPKVIF